ncbi:unnamed protein product [Lymnaea stagnalis]|uniref:Uncharacterized protein n=1 Tax=Lymnaea stagnalis TaxID=6523 RepID=A0AAV2IM71_LYMST
MNFKTAFRCLVVLCVALTVLMTAFNLEACTNCISAIDHVIKNQVKETKSSTIEFLANELKKKLSLANVTANIENITTLCQILKIQYVDKCNRTDIDDNCTQRQLPENLETRIEQLVFRKNLIISPYYRDVIRNMTSSITRSYDLIIVSALSSNHYNETQAMLKNLHQKVFEFLADFLLVLFDLGLTSGERSDLEKYCRCTVITFPFHLFPPHFERLKCFAWKPTIIRSMMDKADVVLWQDTSIRYTQPDVIPVMMRRAIQRGVQQRYYTGAIPNPYFTLPQMFEFFGDSPCAHMAFFQCESGFGMYHREPLVERAVLDPWFGCALNAACTCPENQRAYQDCPRYRNPTKLGHCMRNDQSSITVILAKLFRDKFHHFVVNVHWFQDTKRGDQTQYFKTLA